ncbi:hypothetical protein G6F56_000895 [Rhizopus delemar]|uniref:Split finger protein n=1 Tax=Rhizopus stolonifer TaxID=4846 RepID=A0A367KXP1_RHIST|nr:hypothetical protein G6F56_000895 [Rhizopus delemar]RCI06971.1 split finger protein [Rhizopus stolonifer]
MNIPGCQGLKSIDERQAVEDKYFRDITCCGQRIATLHNLMEHHEKFHDMADFRESDEEEGYFKSTIRYEDVFFPVSSNVTAIRPEIREPSLRYFTSTQEYNTIDTNLLLQPSTAQNSPGPVMLPLFDFVQKAPNTRPVVMQVQNVCTEKALDTEKRYVCHEFGCDKVYKNLNGLRYHQKHGHSTGEEPPRPHVCKLCGKSYKASNGLRYHMEHMHTPIS